ncbi:MAG: arsenite methyltransferase [Planctomycetota bacterium]
MSNNDTGCCGADATNTDTLPADASGETIRDTVSKAYTEALRKAEEGAGGCCGPAPTSSCGTGTAIPAGVAAQTAGYDTELTQVPEGAAKSSFGCGNPLAFAGMQPGQTVLDLGSGGGLDLIVAAHKVGPTGRVIGVDMTDAMIDAARRHIDEAGVTWAEVRKGIIEELPVEDASVDWVISNCVINLSADKDKVFAEIARVLKPGGRVSISDIVAESLPARLRLHAASYAACIGGAISEMRYLAGLADAGLTNVRVTDRVVYDAMQLHGIVGTDLDNAGVSREGLEEMADAAAGRVWSARFTGTKPGRIGG